MLIAIGVMWAATVWFLLFGNGGGIGFGVSIPFGNHLSQSVRYILGSVLLIVVVLGWVVPLLWGIATAITRRD